MRIPLLISLAAALAAADPWERLAEASRLPAAEARGAIEKLILENPAFHAARFNLGSLLIDSDPAKAAEHLELATASPLPGLTADAWHNLALARFKQGRLDDALRAAEQAATLDPQMAALRDEVRRVVLVRQDEARRAAEAEARKLHLAPAPLPAGRVGEAYAARLPIAGGSPPATAVLAGSAKLPDGLQLGSDGSITGTPRTAGTAKLDVELSDAAGAKANGSVELRILPAPAITTAKLPEAVIGQPYEARLEAVGLDVPMRWSVAGLPAGLSVGADGRIGGTPTIAATATLHVHVDDGKRQADRLIDLAVSDAFAPAEDPLPAATAGAAYRHRATVRGPAQAYRWSSPAGNALMVSADGTVAGTPPSAGAMNLPVTIAAADGRTREVELHLTVNPRPLIQTEPITLHVGSPADQPLRVEGGTAPFTWTVAGGTVPAGLRLDADGHLRGVAKDPGTTTLTIAVSDQWKASTQAEVQITVEPAQNQPPQPDKDKDKDKDKDQAKQDQQQGQQGQDQSKQGQQGQDQSKQGQQGQDQSKQQQGQEQGQHAQAAQAQPGTDGTDGNGKDGTDAGAAILNQTAADRWLDQLPHEDRDVLRYQLLKGSDGKPGQSGKKSW